MALFMLIKKFIKDLWRKEISDVDIDKLSVILSQDSLLNYLIVYDLLPGTFKHQRSMLIERRAQPAHQIQNDYRMPEVHADSFKVFRKRCKQELMDKHPLPAAQIPTSEEPYDRQKIADDIVILFAKLKATLIEKDLASEELIKYLDYMLPKITVDAFTSKTMLEIWLAMKFYLSLQPELLEGIVKPLTESMVAREGMANMFSDINGNPLAYSCLPGLAERLVDTAAMILHSIKSMDNRKQSPFDTYAESIMTYYSGNGDGKLELLSALWHSLGLRDPEWVEQSQTKYAYYYKNNLVNGLEVHDRQEAIDKIIDSNYIKSLPDFNDIKNIAELSEESLSNLIDPNQTTSSDPYFKILSDCFNDQVFKQMRSRPRLLRKMFLKSYGITDENNMITEYDEYKKNRAKNLLNEISSLNELTHERISQIKGLPDEFYHTENGTETIYQLIDGDISQLVSEAEKKFEEADTSKLIKSVADKLNIHEDLLYIVLLCNSPSQNEITLKPLSQNEIFLQTLFDEMLAWIENPSKKRILNSGPLHDKTHGKNCISSQRKSSITQIFKMWRNNEVSERLCVYCDYSSDQSTMRTHHVKTCVSFDDIIHLGIDNKPYLSEQTLYDFLVNFESKLATLASDGKEQINHKELMPNSHTSMGWLWLAHQYARVNSYSAVTAKIKQILNYDCLIRGYDGLLNKFLYDFIEERDLDLIKKISYNLSVHNYGMAISSKNIVALLQCIDSDPSVIDCVLRSETNSDSTQNMAVVGNFLIEAIAASTIIPNSSCQYLLDVVKSFFNDASEIKFSIDQSRAILRKINEHGRHDVLIMLQEKGVSIEDAYASSNELDAKYILGRLSDCCRYSDPALLMNMLENISDMHIVNEVSNRSSETIVDLAIQKHQSPEGNVELLLQNGFNVSGDSINFISRKKNRQNEYSNNLYNLLVENRLAIHKTSIHEEMKWLPLTYSYSLALRLETLYNNIEAFITSLSDDSYKKISPDLRTELFCTALKYKRDNVVQFLMNKQDDIQIETLKNASSYGDETFIELFDRAKTQTNVDIPEMLTSLLFHLVEHDTERYKKPLCHLLKSLEFEKEDSGAVVEKKTGISTKSMILFDLIIRLYKYGNDEGIEIFERGVESEYLLKGMANNVFCTTLRHVCINGHTHCLYKLLKVNNEFEKLDINNPATCSPLLMGEPPFIDRVIKSEKASENDIQLLLKYGSNVSKENIIDAIEANKNSIATMLVKHRLSESGASSELSDDDKEQIKDSAEKYNITEIMELIDKSNEAKHGKKPGL